MTGSEQNAAGSFSLADNMTGGGCAQNAILSNKKLLDPIGAPNLRNSLHDLRVPIASVSTDDKKAAFDAFWYREEYACDKRFAVMGLLEDLDFFAKTRSEISHLLALIHLGCRLWDANLSKPNG